jgi:hypothetical protein
MENNGTLRPACNIVYVCCIWFSGKLSKWCMLASTLDIIRVHVNSIIFLLFWKTISPNFKKFFYKFNIVNVIFAHQSPYNLKTVYVYMVA